MILQIEICRDEYMNYVAENVPLWTVTTWDKKYNAVDRTWQPQTIKYNYLLSDELDNINIGEGNVRLLYTGKDIGYTTEELAGENLCEGEVVSIPWGGTPSVKYYKGKFVTGDNRIATSNNPKELSNKYLYYYLRGHISEIASYYRGAGLKHPSMKDVLKMKISYPSLANQNKICDQFDAIERIIEQRTEEIHLLDELIKARFVEMFGDCRINPKGWTTVALGDISMVGSSKRVFVEDLQESGIPFYRGTEVGALAEGKSITPELFITEEHYNTLVDATGKPEIGDLLMPSICPDGRIWVVNTEEPFYFKDGRVLWVHDIDEKYDPVFLLYTLKDRIMTDYGSIASGTTFAELKIFALKQCQVFDVPMEEQKRFAAFINQVDKSKLS